MGRRCSPAGPKPDKFGDGGKNALEKNVDLHVVARIFLDVSNGFRGFVDGDHLGQNPAGVHLLMIDQVNGFREFAGAGAGAADVHFLAGNHVRRNRRFLLGPPGQRDASGMADDVQRCANRGVCAGGFHHALCHTAVRVFADLLNEVFLAQVDRVSHAQRLGEIKALFDKVDHNRLRAVVQRDHCGQQADRPRAVDGDMFIIAVASAMGWGITTMRLPQKVSAWCLAMANSKLQFMFITFILLVIIGTLVDVTPAILIIVPILIPAARAFNVNMLYFGLFVAMTLTMGLVTPPVGMLLFTTSTVAKIDLSRMYKAILPYAAVEILFCILMIFAEPILMFLPHLLGY